MEKQINIYILQTISLSNSTQQQKEKIKGEITQVDTRPPHSDS